MSEFPKGKSADGYYTYCRSCSTAKQVAYRTRIQSEDPQKWAAARRRAWDKAIAQRYGLSPEKVTELREQQDGRCPICLRTPEQIGKGLVIDHDHACCPGAKSCGQCVRGLLCDNCNVGLGRLQDDAELLRRAVAYLEPRRPS